MGAAWAMVPLAGCGASVPDPKAAPLAAGNDAILTNSAAKTGDPHPAATAGNDASPVAPTENSETAIKDLTADARPDAALKSSFSRVIGRVGRNHGHLLTVSFADVKAGAMKSYDFAGSAGHPHSVTLSGDDMQKLLAGEIVRTKSTTDRGHAHRVVARCAPPVDPPEWVSVCTFTSSGRDEHEMVITAADLAAKAEKTYDIQGLAGHSHQVTLSAADFQKLTIGGPVTLHSTRDPDDAHLHTVSIEHRVPAKAGKT
jgi:hypothetical protein